MTRHLPKPRAAMALPALSELSKTEASALEQIAIAAGIQFRIQVDEARDRHRIAVRNDASAIWIGDALDDLERAERLYTAAHDFQRAAHLQCLHAGIVEARAIRAIEAFATAAMETQSHRSEAA